MTTSRETDWMDQPRIRRLVDEAHTLSLAEQVTLVKGLIPRIAHELSPTQFEGFVNELRLKGARYHEAASHPGEGRAQRTIPGERELEGR